MVVSVNDFVSLDQKFSSLCSSALYWIFEKRRVRFGSDSIKHHLTGKKSHKSETFK